MILAVVALSLLLLGALLYLPKIGGAISAFLGALRPIFTGAVVAYLLSPIAKRLEAWLQRRLKKTKLSDTRRDKLSLGLSVVGALLLLLLLLAGFFAMLLPQLYVSLIGLANSIPDYFQDAEATVLKWLEDDPQLRAFVETQLARAYQGLTNLLNPQTFNRIWDFLSGLTSSVISVVGFVVDLALGFVASVYILWSRRRFLAQAKKITAAFCRPGLADRLFDTARRIHRTFSGYIVGTLTDALIVGIITYIATTLMGMPYTPIIATVVGVTNIIPILGPFLGAVPSALLILLADPWKCLYFILFIVILQQVDGNIIAPRIIGSNTGLSGFWVLTAITVAGSLFGLAGMVVCVPTMAVLYALISEWVSGRLARKGMPTDTAVYGEIQRMSDLASSNEENP
ncbi:MAG TPA: AI-2E family transporter [Candidatus Avoscillospira avicola]|uniref:AI-2E family transporter n=1 Tax=Candidatus Avoscillospira avicola TaxID=2840706 RepID=A0A9D1DGG4_9FIRM|nr:AI-2E family transporter [Candidatus Avoscillospira avicola]